MPQGQAHARLDAAHYTPQLCARGRIEGHQHGEADELLRHLEPRVLSRRMPCSGGLCRAVLWKCARAGSV